MDPTIFTPRLKLTLVTKADRGSAELEWCHELRSNKEATWWSIHGQAKSIEDTKKVMKNALPTNEEWEKTYRVVYAVHIVAESMGETVTGDPGHDLHAAERQQPSSKFAGLVNLRSVDANSLSLPENLLIPAAAATTTLTVELAYHFLPVAWSKGYATESMKAVFDSSKRARSFWAPFSKLYVYAIVNEENTASMRVMQKTGMTENGIYEWAGKAIFLAGQWQERSSLHIFGTHLLQ